MKATFTDRPADADYAIVYVAMELSKRKWKLGVILPNSQKMRRCEIDGGDTRELQAVLARIREKAERSSGLPVRIITCYEAGLDGHWLHRWLTDHGILNYEIDPASIEVNRRKRRPKTDRVDLERIMRSLFAHRRGEPRALSVVRVPSVAEEDRKRTNREHDRLITEQTRHINRIRGLLTNQGIRGLNPRSDDFLARLAKARTGDGRTLERRLCREIEREHARLRLVEQQLDEVEIDMEREMRTAAPGTAEAKMKLLSELKAIGPVTANGLVNEVFYRDFDNRRQLGSYLGLTGTPYDTGDSHRDQGISKAGNRRARRLAMELAWRWVRMQPESELSRWFHERVGNTKGRIRRIAIVAVARKLMIALWRYVTVGLVPAGARFYASPLR